jgi:membrane fusion protein (multidrug efflux system)
MDGDQSTLPRPAAVQSQTETADPPPPRPVPRRRRVLPFIVLFLVLGGAGAAGVWYWREASRYATTDDAFIDADISQVSARIAGRVTQIPVDDNQAVRAGQVLVQLDPADEQVRLDQALAQQANAEASVAQARAQLALQQANLEQAMAMTRVGEADLTQAQQDLGRYRSIDPHAVTRQQLDNAAAAARSMQAKLDADHHAVAAGEAQVAAVRAQIDAAVASVNQMKVGVAQARLQLSYDTITAPQAGRVTKKTVQLGNYVTPGQALLAVVPEAVYVTANFKETQLGAMRAGQAVAISVDAYPQITFRGRVDSFQNGTGSAFSSLPAENATGNYVKVIQRVPVRIVFDDDRIRSYRLAPGMSVSPKVSLAEAVH